MSDPKVNIRAEEADVRIEIRVSNDGKDGYTPQRGVDYWTEEDQEAIKKHVEDCVADKDLSGAITDEQLAKALREYLEEHPIEGVGVPTGGKAGQYLCKQSDKDYDVAWADIVVPEQYGLVTYDQDKTITIT